LSKRSLESKIGLAPSTRGVAAQRGGKNKRMTWPDLSRTGARTKSRMRTKTDKLWTTVSQKPPISRASDADLLKVSYLLQGNTLSVTTNDRTSFVGEMTCGTIQRAEDVRTKGRLDKLEARRQTC
jgi:hypothetical protein